MIDEDDAVIDEEVGEEAEVETSEEAGGPDESIKADARQMGWVPKEEFRGNPNDWVDADAFVQRGREIMPILRKNNERLLDKVKQLEQDMLESRNTLGDFRKYHEQALDQQRKAALTQLKAARKEAISNSDGEAFDQIEEYIREVEETKVVHAPAPRVAPDPKIEAWFEKNPWYKDDIALQDVANEVAERLTRGRPDLKGVEFLESVKAIVQERMPAKFKNPARNSPAAVEGSTPRAPRSGKSYNDLPSDVKAMCDRFVRDIPGFTREQFVKDYQWS